VTKPAAVTKKAPIVANTPELYKSSASEDLKKLPKFDLGDKSKKE